FGTGFQALIKKKLPAFILTSAEHFTGLSSRSNGDNSSQQSDLWRPWFRNEGKNVERKVRLKFLFLNPNMLYWPKSRFFDYLYRDAEILLRNYPVQAAICPYEDSSSDEDNDDEEEEVEKEQN
uniref:Ripply transcriptional repressor 2 n=1 Tax=Amphilophus citrinellus TaxID=61819 RepID=A0A3Q0RKE9_AMPCI